MSNIHQENTEEIRLVIGKFVSFQDEYSLACRKNEADILDIYDSLKMTPITWGSLGQGIPTGKYDHNTVFNADDRRNRDVYVNFHGDKLLKNLKIIDTLNEIAAKKNRSIASCAICFILDYIPSCVVLAGVKWPQQLLSNIEAMGWKDSKEELQMLDQISSEKLITEIGEIYYILNIQPSSDRKEAA